MLQRYNSENSEKYYVNLTMIKGQGGWETIDFLIFYFS